MSRFHLVPVDGGAPVHLPPGETVLGRGPLLAVSDKRVSRQHALLDNLRGRLRLKPTHLNPCFLQSSLSDDPRPLSRDSWVRLRDGDILSLLPGQLLFRVEEVEQVGGATRPLRNSQTQEEEEEEEEEGDCPNNLNQEVEEEQRAMKTRVLPAWMMTAVAAPQSSTVQSTVKRQATPPATASPGEAGLSEKEERRGKKRRRKDVPSEEPNVRQGSNESEGFAMETGGDTPTEDSVGGSEKENRKSVSVSSSHRRTPCPYGTDCYRKNPLHFQECSHPGDPDHEQEQEQEEADRAECPYGTACYRKNPLHRKEYKHTQRLARATRNPAHEEDEDADSFIDSDSDGDLDYVPPDSDDSGEEDVKRLQREAQLFLKRKK